MVIKISPFSQAIGSGRGCIYNGNFKTAAGLVHIDGIAKIQLVEYGFVEFGRIGSRSQMKYKLYLLVIQVKPCKKIITVNAGDIFLILEIPVFYIIVESINKNYLLNSLGIELTDKIASE